MNRYKWFIVGGLLISASLLYLSSGKSKKEEEKDDDDVFRYEFYSPATGSVTDGLSRGKITCGPDGPKIKNYGGKR